MSLNAKIKLRKQDSVIMGSEQSLNYTKDIWRDERSPLFREEHLRCNETPQDGKIYVMYHGTTTSAALTISETGFKRSEDGMLGRGVYVTRDIAKALSYPIGDKTDQVILKLRVNVGKVKKIDYQNHPMQKTWHDNGYDTAWVPPDCGMVGSGLEEDCVWDPKRIKVLGFARPTPFQTYFQYWIESMKLQLWYIELKRALNNRN